MRSERMTRASRVPWERVNSTLFDFRAKSSEIFIISLLIRISATTNTRNTSQRRRGEAERKDRVIIGAEGR